MNRAQLVDEIFSEALEVPVPEREALVQERCGGDEELVTRILFLLELSQRPVGAIEKHFGAMRSRFWQELLSHDSEYGEDLSGSLVGSWLIEKLIARGGLATVYLAQRDDGGFRQRAAFKVLRRGLDTDDLVSRFHAEREILSSLEHPGIAKILDGGALDDGRPFLVLEFVDGLPITRHCEQNKLGIRERVDLIINVAQAIGHAHRRLVVHRDIKPSNILVSARGNISVLDFGIAKLLDPTILPARSPVTRTGMSMLTPAYASPEQHARKQITTASDIYQLGLILYELLSGQRPFSGDGNNGLTTLPAPSQSIQTAKLRRHIQGDLDAIVHKAAHVDVDQRYSSTDELIADLKRYLEGLPIQARPDSWHYRLGKLNRRKPWLLPLLALAVIATGSYLITLSMYSARLAKQQQLTAASQDFLIDLFKSSDPFEPADNKRGSSITVVDALEIGYRRVRTELKDQPELRASLLSAISEVYASLDVSNTAIELREEALQIELSIYGERSPQVVASLRALGSLYSGAGNGKKAAEYLDKQLLIARQVFAENSPEIGLSEIAAGFEAQQTGDQDRSQKLLLSGVEKLRPETKKYASTIISVLIYSSEQQGLESEQNAMADAREALELAVKTYGADSLQVASARIRVASIMTRLGEYEAAEANFLAVLPLLEQQLGADHSVTLTALNNLGYLYSSNGQLAEAEKIFRELVRRQIAKNGQHHRSVGDSYQNLAAAITYQGRYGESIPIHRKAYEIYKNVFDDKHYLIAFPLLSISYAELKSGHGPQAEVAAREALSRFQAALPGSFLEGVAQCLLGLSLAEQGQTAAGNALVTASHKLMENENVPAPYPELCRLTGL